MKEYEIKFDAATIQLFDEYLHECRNKGIKVILVYTPEYIEGQKFVKNREEMFKLFINLSLKYNIPFWDYSNDAISFQKKYFYNSSHMNKKGAELFTNKLTNALKEYIEKIQTTAIPVRCVVALLQLVSFNSDDCLILKLCR